MRSEVTSSPLKPNYNQLMQQNESLADTVNTLRRNYNDPVDKHSKVQDELSYSLSDVNRSKSIIRSI